MRSLDDAQRAKASDPPVDHEGRPASTPTCRTRSTAARWEAWVRTTASIPYQGVPATDLSDAQRRLLLDVARSYKGWIADAHAAVSMAEIESHLDETWFSWYGG